MPKTELLRSFEQNLRLKEQTLTGQERLCQVPNWDSMATLAFIVWVDRKFGVPLKSKRVLACQTVDDLLSLIGNTQAAA